MYPLFLWAPSPKHLLLPGAGALLLGKLAAAGPECEWPTLLPSTGNLTRGAGREGSSWVWSQGAGKGGTGHLNGGKEGAVGCEAV